MTAPISGCRVRLAALRGVSSPAMHDQVGMVGYVQSARRRRDGTVLVEARFSTPNGAYDTFWLQEGEYELLDAPAQPTAPTPPAPTVSAPKEEDPVADFATAVRARIDQLRQTDGELGRQGEEIAQQRTENARELKALEAALAGYARVRGTGPKALAAPRRGPHQGPRASPDAKVWPVLERMLAGEDGWIVRATAAAALVDGGLYGTYASANTAIGVVLLRHADELERVAKGVYRLREAS